jgi:hypothetical protein
MPKLSFNLIAKPLTTIKKMMMIVLVAFCVEAATDDIQTKCESAEDVYQCYLDSLDVERYKWKCINAPKDNRYQCLKDKIEAEPLKAKCENAMDEYSCLVKFIPTYQGLSSSDFFADAMHKAMTNAYDCKSDETTAVFLALPPP